jgi:hypothetical protein
LWSAPLPAPASSLTLAPTSLAELSPPVAYGEALTLDNDGIAGGKGDAPIDAGSCVVVKGSGRVKRLLRAVPKRKIPEQP